MLFSDIYKTNHTGVYNISLKQKYGYTLSSFALNHKNLPHQTELTFNFFKNEELMLIDLTVVDTLAKRNRFKVKYLFLVAKVHENQSYFVYLETKSRKILNPKTITASRVFFSALSTEREMYDMYGVLFLEHPDLRRILSDYSFKGHPLRKDFPLSGYLQIGYSNVKKALMFVTLKLAQEFRCFTFPSPWVDFSPRDFKVADEIGEVEDLLEEEPENYENDPEELIIHYYYDEEDW